MTNPSDTAVALIAPKKRGQWPTELNALIGLIGIAIVFEVLGWAVRDQSFFGNLIRLKIMILQVSIIGIIAIGVTQVIISGGIDLSSGSIVGATAMIAMSFAQVATYNKAVFLDIGLVDLPVIIPIVVGLGCGLLAGFTNGVLIAYTKIPPFIATLGMMVTARGIAQWWTKGKPVSFPTDTFAALGDGMMPVVIFIGVAIGFYFILKFTVYGKHTYAIGSNEDAARMSGINVERHKVLVYTIAGTLAGLAAMVLAARGLTAQAGMGVMYELDAIAMSVIGGVSLAGGRDSIVGTCIGMLIFGVIISGFTFLRVDAFFQEMIKGAIIVAAVVVDMYRQRRRQMES